MGLLDSMKALLSDRGGRELDEAFVPVALLPRERIVIGDLTVTPFPVEHTDPTFALVIESDGARLAYTSDTSWGAPAIAAARGADLLLCEATLPEEYADASPHLTASQAGELAREAAVKSMLLTHLWPTNDREVALAQARAEFSGPIALATEFEVHEIGEPKGRF
jgi:ribonuclease BN (tRNA processing enzyme)